MSNSNLNYANLDTRYASSSQLTTFRNGMIVSATLSGDNLVLKDFSGNTVFTGNVRGPQGDVASVTNLGTITSGPLDLTALTQGGVVVFTLAYNLAVINLPTVPAGKTCTIELVITQDSTGSRVITYPTGMKASESNPPMLSTAAGVTDTIAFVWDSVRWKVRLIERAIG